MQVSRIHAARKSEWLKSALSHHFSPDPCAENEIVVLATGVDQYLQEVFHHLAFYNGDDLVSDEDFRSLCLVLGIPASAETDGLPRVLNFKDFHARLCGFFSLKASEGETGARLLVSEETEHIEREIRLRCPRVRRRKCVSFDLSAEQQNRRRTVRRSGPAQSLDHQQTNTTVEIKRSVVDISPQRRLQQQLELENASLRELVEDLRSALQSSDARCISLEVALRRKHTPGGTPEKQDCKTKTQHPKHMDWDSRRGTKDLLRELELIRASRDGQLEEAMRFNQRLEEELMAAYGELSRMQETLENVRKENARIKKRTEEVRGALAAGLEHVKTLQDQAKQADLLRERVQCLEKQMEKIRAQCTCMEANMNRSEIVAELRGSGFPSSIGHDDPMIKREEDLQRSVEGRAASDEEEEEQVIDKGQCCHLQVKRLINRLHSCTKGCQKAAICTWLVSQSSAHSREAAGCVWIPPADDRRAEAGQMKHKEDSVRSALEDRLTDALTLLLQIPHKRVSRRILGKILINTLDLCTRRSHDVTPVDQVVNTLCQQLLSSELLDGGEEVSAGSRPSVSPGHPNTANPLLMSC
ncbi:EF-hand and coiled-coil domain-containing protein 1 [Danio aesculapii]|uniref:EF-hand and coiled-coil domain-containing protein 1 n=1 Tax=Danio aesculapii TaxID=1142201 RepID=UPI0024BF495F|nr:EF-hand and coiled-coil domain-containing protein 1 [Danio aesculapii]XP_056324558.1 EF-hand and coiled-coil domain-containing protein 1 [Danio aesculapii]